MQNCATSAAGAAICGHCKLLQLLHCDRCQLFTAAMAMFTLLLPCYIIVQHACGRACAAVILVYMFMHACLRVCHRCCCHVISEQSIVCRLAYKWQHSHTLSLHPLLSFCSRVMHGLQSDVCRADLHTIGGLPTLLNLLQDPHASVRWRAAEVVATCVQNNPPVQQVGALPSAIDICDRHPGQALFRDAACWFAVIKQA